MKTNFKSAKEYIKLKKKEGSESLCGSGSHMSNASDVIDFIQKTIDKHNIKSILDLGCGDWNWFKEINFSKNINYIGWDCDKEMIESNEQKYGSDKIKFEEKKKADLRRLGLPMWVSGRGPRGIARQPTFSFRPSPLPASIVPVPRHPRARRPRLGPRIPS